MGQELCNVWKVLDETCDLLVYSRKVGRQQIGSLSQEDTCSHYEQNVHLMLCQIFVFTMKRNIPVDIKQLKDIV